MSWSSFGNALGISTHVGSALRGRARRRPSPSSRREGSSSRGTGRDTPRPRPVESGMRAREQPRQAAWLAGPAWWVLLVRERPRPPRIVGPLRRPGLPDERLVAPLHVACRVGAPLDMARIRRPRPGLAWFPRAEARGVRPAPPVAADGDADLVPRRPAWLRPVRLASLVLARGRVAPLVGPRVAGRRDAAPCPGRHGERPGGPAGGSRLRPPAWPGGALPGPRARASRAGTPPDRPQACGGIRTWPRWPRRGGVRGTGTASA